jgi:hypothetical protein
MPDLHDALTELAAAYARDTVGPGADAARRLGQRRRLRRVGGAVLVALLLVAGVVGGRDVIGDLGRAAGPVSPPATTMARPMMVSLAQLQQEVPDLTRTLESSDGSFQTAGSVLVVRGTHDGRRWRFVLLQGRGRALDGGCYFSEDSPHVGGALSPCVDRGISNPLLRRISATHSSVVAPGIAAWYGFAPTDAVKVRLRYDDGRPPIVFNTIDISPVYASGQFQPWEGRIWIGFGRSDHVLHAEFLDANGQTADHWPNEPTSAGQPSR